MEFILKTPQDMADLVQYVLSKSPKVIGLYGDLGAGKTTFSQSLARELGITETVNSPTFVIMKKYDIPTTSGKNFKTLIHIDAYRLKSSHELAVLGWQEILANPENIVAIEWPELVADIMPSDHTRVELSFVDENIRRAVVK